MEAKTGKAEEIQSHSQIRCGLVTNTIFRKSSLENLFLKKWPLLLLIIDHIIQTFW